MIFVMFWLLGFLLMIWLKNFWMNVGWLLGILLCFGFDDFLLELLCWCCSDFGFMVCCYDFFDDYVEVFV